MAYFELKFSKLYLFPLGSINYMNAISYELVFLKGLCCIGLVLMSVNDKKIDLFSREKRCYPIHSYYLILNPFFNPFFSFNDVRYDLRLSTILFSQNIETVISQL